MPISTFTFFVEREGSEPFVEQFSGKDIEAAVMKWYRESRTKPAPYDPEGAGINAITGVLNVWCISGLDPFDLFYLVHIVGPVSDLRVLKEPTNVPVYTFITDKDGGTYIEQFEGVDIQDAISRWHELSHTAPGPCIPDEDLEPVPGVRGLWRIRGVGLDNRFYITHVVPTLRADGGPTAV